MRQSAALGDIELSFQRQGSGIPFVWGHGLTSSMELEGEFLNLDWASIEPYADVVRYDARGHGLSTLTTNLDDYSWAHLADDQIALADALDIATYVAGGASMGAATALHVAVRAPLRMRGLVLAIPPTAWETRDAQRSLYLDRAQLVVEGKRDEVIAAAKRVPPPDPFGVEWHDRIERNTLAADQHQMACVLRGAATADFPTREQVAAIAVPTLILAWSGDAGHPVSSAEQLHELIGPSELSVAATAAEFASWSERIASFIQSLR